MKHALSAVTIIVILTMSAKAEEVTTQADKADKATEDCSKQVWPHFTPSCLRNADRATSVRLVTTNRTEAEFGTFAKHRGRILGPSPTRNFTRVDDCWYGERLSRLCKRP